MRFFRNKRLGGPITLAAVGLVVYGAGQVATQIHNATTDCKLDENGYIDSPAACVVDTAAAIAGAAAVVFASLVLCEVVVLPVRDLDTIHSDRDLILLDGEIAPSSEFNHDWVLDNLQKEGDRHYVVVNTTRPGVKLAHELWREGDQRMITTHAQYESATSLERRTTEWYIHGAGDYLRSPASFPTGLIGEDVFNYFYNHKVDSACLYGVAKTSTGSKYYDAWAGISLSTSSTNDAPRTCSPRTTGTHWTLWQG